LHPSLGTPSRTFQLIRLPADIQENAGRQQHYQQTRSSIADERQGNSFGRHHPEHHAKVDHGLAQNHHRDAQRGETPEFIRGLECGANSSPSVNRKQAQHDRSSDESHLFAQYRENEIGVRFRQLK
jgi:hypothetical protein